MVAEIPIGRASEVVHACRRIATDVLVRGTGDKGGNYGGVWGILAIGEVLSVPLPRGDAGSFLHLLSLFPHLDDLSIWTSYLDESLDPLPKNAVAVRRTLVLDSVQEHFADALIGSGLKPKALKISIPRSISYDGLLAACAPSVEIVSLSPTFGQSFFPLHDGRNR